MEVTYYICILKSFGMAPYATDEAILRDYVEYYKVDNPLIYRVNEKQRKAFAMKYLSEEVREQAEGLYCTDSDFDMVIDVLDARANEFYETLKSIEKKMRLFRGKEAKKLKKRIHAFLKERVRNPEFTADTGDPVNILIEKMDLKKYFRKIIRSQIKQLKKFGYAPSDLKPNVYENLHSKSGKGWWKDDA